MLEHLEFSYKKQFIFLDSIMYSQPDKSKMPNLNQGNTDQTSLSWIEDTAPQSSQNLQLFFSSPF